MKKDFEPLSTEVD